MELTIQHGKQELVAPILPIVYPAEARAEVLVVDDQAICRRMTTHLLDKAGISHATCFDGVDAVRLGHSALQAAKLILMDKEMLQMNGVEATRAIRALGVTTPIVALTTCNVDATHEAFIAAGAEIMLMKPLKSEQVNALKLHYSLGEAAESAFALMSEYPHCDEGRPAFDFFGGGSTDEEESEPPSDGDDERHEPDGWISEIVRGAEKRVTLAKQFMLVEFG